jgi:hypothetical protein
VYQAVRWPLPDTPDAERETGAQLTQYLWRGTVPPQGFRFTAG